MYYARFYKDGEKLKWGYHYDLENRRIVNGSRAADSNKKKFHHVNIYYFEGMLLSSNLVRKIDILTQGFSYLEMILFMAISLKVH